MPDSVSSRRRSATHRFNALFLAAPALALALMGVAAPAAAQDYRVEVVLFEHLRSRPPGNGQFLFPSSRSGVSLDTERAAAAGFEPYTGVLDLAEHADRMASSGRYRILRQIAWVQPGLADREAIRLRVALGAPTSLWISPDADTNREFVPASAEATTGRTEELTTFTVNGTLRLRLGRFLHLEARLVYTRPDEGRSYKLYESRKMRSRELHYIDNPRFGILTRIVPVEESAADAEESALVEPLQEDATEAVEATDATPSPDAAEGSGVEAADSALN